MSLLVAGLLACIMVCLSVLGCVPIAVAGGSERKRRLGIVALLAVGLVACVLAVKAEIDSQANQRDTQTRLDTLNQQVGELTDLNEKLTGAIPTGTLKRRALQLAQEILTFANERIRAEGALAEQGKRVRDFSDETRTLYAQQFAVRATTTLLDMRKAGVSVDEDLFQVASEGVNPLVMQDLAIQIGDLASQLRG